MENECDEKFLASLIERPELLERIQVFAHRPQSLIEESRWATFTNQQGLFDDSTLLDWRTNPVDSPRSQRRLSALLESNFDLEKVDYAEFSDPSRRFALFGSALLKRLAFSVGLMRTSPTLKAVISRDQVSRIVDQIGEDSYREAIERGPLTVGANYEGVAISAEELSVNLRTALTRVGWLSLGNVLAGASDSILKRLRLKFSPADEKQFDTGFHEYETEPGLTDLMVRILRNNVNRRAATCVF